MTEPMQQPTGPQSYPQPSYGPQSSLQQPTGSQSSLAYPQPYPPQPSAPHPYGPVHQLAPLAQPLAPPMARPIRPAIIWIALGLWTSVCVALFADALPPSLTLGDQGFSRLVEPLIVTLIVAPFAVFFALGSNWARIVLTVVAFLITLVAIAWILTKAIAANLASALSGTTTPLGPSPWDLSLRLLIIVLLVGTITVMFLPPANQYFRSMTYVRRSHRTLGSSFPSPH